MPTCTLPSSSRPIATPLGSPIPALLPHAISVSLPTWQDNIGYEEGHKRVVNVMETGYPRFFIHRSIQKLADICIAKFGQPQERCILVPSPRVASECRDFILRIASSDPKAACRIVEFVICPSSASLVTAPGANANIAGLDCIELQIVLFPEHIFPIAKQFWQHSGDGVSSRLAERALAFMGERPPSPLATTPKEEPGTAVVEQSASAAIINESESETTMTAKSKMMYSRNRHYSRKPSQVVNQPPTFSKSNDEDSLSIDHATYLEERYGRNLPLTSAKIAKSALRRRIAGELLPHEEPDTVHGGDLKRGGSKFVTENDVYLYPCGMSAIWHSHKIIRGLRERRGAECGKSVCFGFPYTDTLKILQKWGPGCHFFGHGLASDIDALSELLASIRATSSEPPLLALFCEFPSNPLLRSPDLKRLRALADEYGFLIVVDETIGNFVNVEVASWADIVVSSLTKVFSGETNVMGGSLVLSPHSAHYAELKAVLSDQYEDIYFAEDAIYMERNSRDFRPRVATINNNAYQLTEYLRSRSLANPSSAPGSIIKEVYYPRYSTPENYAACQRFPTTGKGGFGGLFSLFFTSDVASRAFYDNLHCAKGPSLGTVFTLASPYAILAHYYELEWAQEYGVERGLVRVSVGLEDYAFLENTFKVAVDAAEAAEKIEKAT